MKKWVSGQGHYQGTPKAWKRIKARADLEDVRLHDLRHTFASVGAASGLSLPLIGALLGHRDSATTARYSHIAEDPVRQATDRVGRRISEALGHNDGGADVVKVK
ncbi:MAG: tyrosine-type recombinase/integrase [Rhizobiaceae bacterium]